MVYVTLQAREMLHGFTCSCASGPAQCLRLKDLGHDKIGIDIDYRHDGDTNVANCEDIDLVIDQQLASISSGISLDAYDTPEGSRLVISKEVIRRSHPCVTMSWVTLKTAAPEQEKAAALATV